MFISLPRAPLLSCVRRANTASCFCLSLLLTAVTPCAIRRRTATRHDRNHCSWSYVRFRRRGCGNRVYWQCTREWWEHCRRLPERGGILILITGNPVSWSVFVQSTVVETSSWALPLTQYIIQLVEVLPLYSESNSVSRRFFQCYDTAKSALLIYANVLYTNDPTRTPSTDRLGAIAQPQTMTRLSSTVCRWPTFSSMFSLLC